MGRKQRKPACLRTLNAKGHFHPSRRCVDMMRPLGPETHHAEAVSRTHRSQRGSRVTPGRATQTQTRGGRRGTLKEEAVSWFSCGKLGSAHKQVQLESPQRTLRAVPCCWWQPEQTGPASVVLKGAVMRVCSLISSSGRRTGEPPGVRFTARARSSRGSGLGISCRPRSSAK